MAKRILAFITTLAIWSVAMAQDGLKISPFFEETYGSSPKVSSVTVSGDKIRENGLLILAYALILLAISLAAVKCKAYQAVGMIFMVGGHEVIVKGRSWMRHEKT